MKFGKRLWQLKNIVILKNTVIIEKYFDDHDDDYDYYDYDDYDYDFISSIGDIN